MPAYKLIWVSLNNRPLLLLLLVLLVWGGRLMANTERMQVIVQAQ